MSDRILGDRVAACSNHLGQGAHLVTSTFNQDLRSYMFIQQRSIDTNASSGSLLNNALKCLCLTVVGTCAVTSSSPAWMQ
jgi:hypothetical protein